MNPNTASTIKHPALSATVILLIMFLVSCSGSEAPAPDPAPAPEENPPIVFAEGALHPVVITEETKYDTDDPAIWIHPTDPSQSLIVGTDKNPEDGALYVFDLDGKIQTEKTVRPILRVNNVDIEYGLMLGGELVDIAVSTERGANKIRVHSLPDMKEIDNGGIEVFTGEEGRQAMPMGISLYKRPSDGTIYAIVGRKSGPSEGYLWQYKLEDDGNGNVIGEKVREFGAYSGLNEIESIAVDDPLGYVYYSDEGSGVRKYHADPDAEGAGEELAIFATVFGPEGFTRDNEGISIYQVNDGTGYILVSDQHANKFRIYKREGEVDDPHNHLFVKSVPVRTNESDGSEITSAVLDPRFPSGLFVAMSDNQTFHYYSWDDIAGDDLVRAPNGEVMP
jgi:myo-inositol-hexaphosphate 3-phosphohydrolase